MRFPSQPSAGLRLLSQGLTDPGDDLQSILAVLVDDLRAAVPSFTGVCLTVPFDGGTVTVTAAGTTPAATSLRLPVEVIGNPPGEVELVFQAAEPDAFLALAAHVHDTYGPAAQVLLDRDLAPPPAAGDGTAVVVTGVEDQSTINQAIGVLIEQGHPPEEAGEELTARADAANTPPLQRAHQILEALVASNRRQPDGSWGPPTTGRLG